MPSAIQAAAAECKAAHVALEEANKRQLELDYLLAAAADAAHIADVRVRAAQLALVNAARDS